MWSMIVLAALMQAWAMSTFQASINTLTGHGQIHAEKFLDDPSVEHRFAPPSGKLNDLLDSSEIKTWASRVRVPAIVQTERDTAPVTLVGIDPQREQGLSFIADAVTEGRYLTQTDDPGILLGKKLAHRLHTGLNKRVVLMSQNRGGSIAERGFKVVGIYTAEQEQTEDRYAFVGRSTAQYMLEIGDDISEISFLVKNLAELPDFIQRLRAAAPLLDIESWSSLQPFTQAILDISEGTITLWTVIMFILVAFGLINTLLMAVFERTREFGLLQALGMRPGYILWQVLLESVMLIGLGVLAGFITGAATVLVFHDGLSLGFLAKGAMMFGAGRVLYPQMDWWLGIQIALFVWVMGVLTSLYPAWRAAREVPVRTINQAY
jgi:ABC-type lipoprotein release transport system permease subunit